MSKDCSGPLVKDWLYEFKARNAFQLVSCCHHVRGFCVILFCRICVRYAQLMIFPFLDDTRKTLSISKVTVGSGDCVKIDSDRFLTIVLIDTRNIIVFLLVEQPGYPYKIIAPTSTKNYRKLKIDIQKDHLSMES